MEISCKPNIYVSWSTSELRVRLAPLNQFKPSSKIIYWSFQVGTSFVDLSCFFLSCVCYAFVYMCLLVTRWERADLLALVCGVQLWICHFLIGILGQVWYLIVLIPDLCTLTYFDNDVKRTTHMFEGIFIDPFGNLSDHPLNFASGVVTTSAIIESLLKALDKAVKYQ